MEWLLVGLRLLRCLRLAACVGCQSLLLSLPELGQVCLERLRQRAAGGCRGEGRRQGGWGGVGWGGRGS